MNWLIVTIYDSYDQMLTVMIQISKFIDFIFIFMSSVCVNVESLSFKRDFEAPFSVQFDLKFDVVSTCFNSEKLAFSF